MRSIDVRSKKDTERLLGRRDIHSALRSEWTKHEKGPPDDSEYSDWLVSVNFVPSDNLHQLLKFTGQIFGYTPNESARRLLRYGVPEILRSFSDGPFADVKAYHDVATHASVHTSGVSFGFSPLNENEKTPVDWGRTTGNRKRTYKVVWVQNDGIEWVSDKLCITKADAFRWAAYEAGLALGNEDVIPETFRKNIADILEELMAYLGFKTTNIKGQAIYTILEAFEGGNGVPVMKYSKEEATEIWEGFLAKIFRAHSELEEAEFLYPERSKAMYGFGKK